MTKLFKDAFNKAHRFRESRNGLVNCVTCGSKTGGNNDEEGPAFCENKERFRRIKIAEYMPGFWGDPGESRNIASKRVCDTYTISSLPEGIEKIVLFEKQAILLGSEYWDIHHADPNCPYVIEELRMQKEGNSKRPKVNIIDISEKVPGETVNSICDMPCCESKLPYPLWRVDDYRRRNGLKPDGTEPHKWVRNDLIKHANKVNMSIEEAEAFFNLEKFNSIGDIYRNIVAVSEHLHKCNRLGSRPLSEAVNPVCCGSDYYLFKESAAGSDTHADFWAYNEKLFDSKKGLEKTIKDLQSVPEGIVPLMDRNRILSSAKISCNKYFSGRYLVYGILRELEDEVLISKGLTHFIEIGAVSFSGHDHMWGEFGKGFEGLASFHEE